MMKRRSLLSMSFSGVCVLAVTAAFAMVATGCACKNCGESRAKLVAGSKAKCGSKCAGKCAGKCTTPCKNADGTKKCAADCKKPCCAKKDGAASGSAAAGDTQAIKAAAAGAKKGGCSKKCSKPCGSKAAPGAKGAKVAAAVNKNCPVSGRPVSPGVTTVTDGKTVGFCCGGCIGRWEALTQAEQAKKLAGSM